VLKNVLLLITMAFGSLSWADTEPKKIVIIGAGMAGLSCGYELKQKGYDVVILEAKNRPGGRVYTLREPFKENQYAEAGAVFIIPSEIRALKYIEKFAIPLSKFPKDDFLSFYFFRGQKFLKNPETKFNWPADMGLKEDEKGLSPSHLIFKYVSSALEEIGDVTKPSWPPENLRKYDSMTFAQFLREAGASDPAIQTMRLGYFDLWGNGIDQTSALWVLRDMTFLSNRGDTYTIRGGNDQLPKAFAKILKDNIWYESPVKKIEQDAQGVRVIYSDSSGNQKTLSADYAVITIPFSVLKNIPFNPPLPVEKQYAIENLAYTPVTRFCVQTKGNILKKAGLNQVAYTDIPTLNWIRNVTFNQPGNLEIFETYMTGVQARRMDAMPEREETQILLSDSEKLIPGIKKQVERTAIYSWGQDPWARGGYPWCSPGQMFSILPFFAKAEGRIHFAGEHTSPYPGWIEGALISADRVVSEITKRN
jgi:monoamine oxidase